MQSSYMTFDFGKLHYQHAVSGKKQTILFIPALNSSAAAFTKTGELLKDQFNIIALDIPGHGLSDRLNVQKYSHYYHFDGIVDILLAFLDRLKLTNVYIAGNSLGGNTGIRALPNTKSITGLILLSSIHAENSEHFFNAVRSPEALKLNAKSIFSEEDITTLASHYIAKTAPKEAFTKMTVDLAQTDGHFREHFIADVENQPFPNEFKYLKDSKIPVIYIGGKEDAFITPAYYDRLVQQGIVKRDNLHLLDDVAHVPTLENPERCAQLIADFMQQ